MRSKNVLFIASDNNSTSGAFLSMVRLCTILKDKYNCNILVVLPRNGNGISLLKNNGINSIIIKSYNWFIPYKPRTIKRKFKRFLCYFWMPLTYFLNKRAIKKITSIIKSSNIDLIHLNTSCTYVGAEAALKCEVPYVWHIREFLEEDQERTIWNQKYSTQLFSKANAIITISDALFNKYKSRVKKDNIYKIYNGITKEKFESINRTVFENDFINLLMVGSINKSKGQNQAVEACELLVKEGIKNFKLTLVGKNSEYAKNLMNTVNQKKLNKYISFVGPQKDVEKYYENSDVLLMCSESEAFGRVTVEAMMSGCLVIGSNSGCTKELIDDYKTGFLYKNGDYLDLKNKILFSMNNKSLSNKIALNGRKYMLENMTDFKNAENVYDLYKNVLSKRSENNEK